MALTLVPHYDIYGAQHRRFPFKNTADTCDTKPLERWMEDPRVRTRSELQKVRRQSMIPHESYDIDGDGVVSQKDLFLAKHFDVGGKDYLTDTERARCAKTMSEGFADKFSWRHETSGAMRPFAVSQRRGKILSVDNVDDMAVTYPSHFNANKLPMHSTWSEMKVDRLLDRRKTGERLKENWDQENPSSVPEAVPIMEGACDNPGIAHIHERAQADHEERRLKSGLFATTTYVNPEREHNAVGLGYQTAPEFRTRSQMLGHKKEALIRDLEKRQVNTVASESVRRSTVEAETFQYRDTSKGKRFTATGLAARRKRERMEHELQQVVKKKEYPRYSDSDTMWWARSNKTANPAPLVRSATAPDVLKVESKEPTVDELAEAAPSDQNNCPIECNLPKPKIIPAAKTVFRWSDAHQSGNNERVFDVLRPIVSTKTDHTPLPHWSSFEFIRRHCNREERTTRHNARRSLSVSSLNKDAQARPVDSEGRGDKKINKKAGPAFRTVRLEARSHDSSMMERTLPGDGYSNFGIRSSGFIRAK